MCVCVCVLCIFEVREGRVSEREGGRERRRDAVKRQRDAFRKFVKDESAGKFQDGETGCNHIGEKKWREKKRKLKRREVVTF